MRFGMTAALLLAMGGVQAAQADVSPLASTSSPGAAMILGIPLNEKANLRLRTTLLPAAIGDRSVMRRRSSSMIDFLPGLGGFRISAGLRFDGKRPRGGLGHLMDGGGLGMGEVGSMRRQIGNRGSRPALTMGYGLEASHHTLLGFEAGAIMDKNHNPLTLDQTDMVSAARIARRQLTGNGGYDIGKVVRVSLVQRF